MTRFLAGGLIALVCGGCGDDRTTGGLPIGTETGNALSARLLLPDGTPAKSATAIFRPSNALDSSDSGKWNTILSDSDGWISVRLPKGSWTLESHLGGHGIRLDISPENEAVPSRITLKPILDLSGTLLGIDSGIRIFLPGLARSCIVGASGRFLFESVPPGIHRVLLPGRKEWRLPESLQTSPALIVKDSSVHPQAYLLESHPNGLPFRIRLPDSVVPPHPIVLDPNGTILPLAIGPSRLGSRNLWIGPTRFRSAVIAESPTSRQVSPFKTDSGPKWVWLSDWETSPATVLGPELKHDSSAATMLDSDEGLYLSVPLGARLGTFAPSSLPDSGDFTFLVRARTTSTDFGSLWLLDWTDSSLSQGVRFGLGNGQIRLKAGSTDTSIDWNHRQWNWYALVLESGTIRLHIDGKERIRLDIPTHSRRDWRRRYLGTGGSLAFSAILAWDRSLEGNEATK